MKNKTNLPFADASFVDACYFGSLVASNTAGAGVEKRPNLAEMFLHQAVPAK